MAGPVAAPPGCGTGRCGARSRGWVFPGLLVRAEVVANRDTVEILALQRHCSIAHADRHTQQLVDFSPSVLEAAGTCARIAVPDVTRPLAVQCRPSGDATSRPCLRRRVALLQRRPPAAHALVWKGAKHSTCCEPRETTQNMDKQGQLCACCQSGHTLFLCQKVCSHGKRDSQHYEGRSCEKRNSYHTVGHRRAREYADQGIGLR